MVSTLNIFLTFFLIGFELVWFSGEFPQNELPKRRSLPSPQKKMKKKGLNFKYFQYFIESKIVKNLIFLLDLGSFKVKQKFGFNFKHQELPLLIFGETLTGEEKFESYFWP